MKPETPPAGNHTPMMQHLYSDIYFSFIDNKLENPVTF